MQPDHVHLLVKIPPKVSISEFMGAIKGRTAIRVFKKFPYLRRRPIGAITSGPMAMLDTVGLDEDMIRKYLIYQETKNAEQFNENRTRGNLRAFFEELQHPYGVPFKSTSFGRGLSRPFTQVTFADIPDPDRRIFFNIVPTSFDLTDEQVDR